MSGVSKRKFLYFKLYINNLGNGVFKVLTFSDFSASDDIKTVCQKMFSALPASGVCYRVRMEPTPNGTTTDAYVYCASSKYGFVHVRNHSGIDYYGRVQNGTWSWDSYVLKSDWGDIKQSYPSVISLKSGEWTKTTEITLTSGAWIIIGRGDFPANGNGRRLISLNAGGAETSARNGFSTALPINGSNTNIEITQMRVVSSTETISLRVYQDSGAALETYVCLEAIKVH